MVCFYRKGSNMVIVVLSLMVLCVLLLVRMKKLTDDLKESRRMSNIKGAFLNNITDEIRTPLRSLSALADIMSKDDLYLSKAEKKNISDQMFFNTNVVTTLLDVIVVLAGRAKGQELRIESFSPNLLCRRVIQSQLNNKDISSDVKIQFRRTLDDGFFVKNDVRILELIVSKLITNACKFTKVGEIAVGCTYNERMNRLTIYVQDTGCGIPEDRRDMLFTWFEQPDESRDNAELDLSIVSKLAERIGGFARFDSNYSEGTRILIELPVG